MSGSRYESVFDPDEEASTPEELARFFQDFYRCPHTDEWVYRWANERFSLRRLVLIPVRVEIGEVADV